ncbi:MAG: thiamine pyrophosphate-dependent enzyme [Ramlibacter sp.]
MAERSFADEVNKLRLGAGEEFHGEGILAVTKALLQSGVSFVAGYPGAPISHLMDVLTDASGILRELGVRFEHSASEAAAAATLAACVNYPLRGAVTFKSTVGTNVASDAIANLASGGVSGGALLIVGEDYGEGSSIMQERSHAFAMKSQVWLLDPRPNLPGIVAAVEQGFELSEASCTPVMLELRIRACHVHGSFIAKANRRADFTLKDAMEQPRRDVERIALPPSTYLHEQEKVAQRWPAAVRFIRERELNEFFAEGAQDFGIVLQGGLYNGVLRALELLGLADAFGRSRVPLYVLNVTYPLVDAEFTRFCTGKRGILLVEEGQPDFIEQAVHAMLRRAGVQTRVHGKDVLPMAGEYTGGVLLQGVARFVERYAPQLLAGRASPRAARPAPAPARMEGNPKAIAIRDAVSQVQGRPPSFCTGCPERPIFTAIKLLERELGPHHISCDIGCHLFSILPPFNLGATTMGYGLGWAGAAAFNTPETGKRTLSIMGDGGFWHNGLTSGVGNAVFNRTDNVLVVIDNGYCAATGGQDVLSSKATNPLRATNHPIERAVRGVGVDWVRTVDQTYSLAKMRQALREALTTPAKGPKVVVASSECMLNKQRRIKPLVRKGIAGGQRVVRERFGVDADTCTGDHSCIRLSGCPSLTIKSNPDPLRRDPVASVIDSCVGCGLCGEVAHAALLCPSFYRAEIINNPSRWDRLRQRVRSAVIGWLQGRTDRRLQGLAG